MSVSLTVIYIYMTMTHHAWLISKPGFVFRLCRTLQHVCDTEASKCEVHHHTSQRQQPLLGAGLPLVSIWSFTEKWYTFEMWMVRLLWSVSVILLSVVWSVSVIQFRDQCQLLFYAYFYTMCTLYVCACVHACVCLCVSDASIAFL